MAVEPQAGAVSGRAPEDLIELAKVSGAHGVRGWLKLQPYSPDAAALQKARQWWLSPPDASAPRAYTVLACRHHPGQALLAQLEGIAERDAAQELRGYAVSLPRALFPAPQKDEYYWVDLQGCDFYGSEHGARLYLGQVAEVFDNGAHAVLQINRGSRDAAGGFVPLLDARGRTRQILVPFVAAHVLQVDLAAKRIESDWPADF